MSISPFTLRSALSILLLAGGACSKTPDEAAPASPTATAGAEGALPDRDPALARRLVRDEGAVLLDVRSQSEFDEGHVEGAVLIPHDQLAERLAEVTELTGGDKHKPIVVYCRSGKRATTAKEILNSAGHDRVTNLGGFTDWCEDCGK